MKNISLSPPKHADGSRLMAEEDINTILYLAKKASPKYIVDIGTYKGYTAHILAKFEPSSTVYTVSITKEMDIKIETDDTFHAGLGETVLSEEKTGWICQRDNNVVQVFGDTTEKGTWQKLPQKVDMFFIDGCHLYRYIVSDTQNALKKQPKLIVWHDCLYDGGFFERNVVKALEDMEKQIGLIQSVKNSRIAFWRKDS